MSSDLPDFAREVEGPFVEGEPVKYDEGKIDEKIPPLQLQLGDLHARRLEMLQVKDDAAKRQTSIMSRGTSAASGSVSNAVPQDHALATTEDAATETQVDVSEPSRANEGPTTPLVVLTTNTPPADTKAEPTTGQLKMSPHDSAVIPESGSVDDGAGQRSVSPDKGFGISDLIFKLTTMNDFAAMDTEPSKTTAIHARFPLILLEGDKYFAIACGTCGVNAYEDPDGSITHFDGAIQLASHIKGIHEDDLSTMDNASAIAKIITKREVTALEAETLKTGRKCKGDYSNSNPAPWKRIHRSRRVGTIDVETTCYSSAASSSTNSPVPSVTSASRSPAPSARKSLPAGTCYNATVGLPIAPQKQKRKRSEGDSQPYANKHSFGEGVYSGTNNWDYLLKANRDRRSEGEA